MKEIKKHINCISYYTYRKIVNIIYIYFIETLNNLLKKYNISSNIIFNYVLQLFILIHRARTNKTY